jgi:hypothetical protein
MLFKENDEYKPSMKIQVIKKTLPLGLLVFWSVSLYLYEPVDQCQLHRGNFLIVHEYVVALTIIHVPVCLSTASPAGMLE